MANGGTKVGSAYLSVVPKLSSDFGSKVSAPGSSHGREYGDKFSQGASSTLKAGAVALGNILADAFEAAAVKAGDLFKTALGGYAEHEQLIGGIETLFGTRGAKDVEEYAAIVHKSVESVAGDFESHQRAQVQAIRNANRAYETAGMSANAYMDLSTSFAASLVSSLGGNTEKAVSYADMAITDMSDNANKMGTDIGRITDAYSGFSRQNYTMLDNLKLGYGGTKAEMERLLKDAEAIKAAQGEVAEYSIDSYADIVEAIHVVQDEMGITGTTSEEAATTIQGSMNMASAAFDNFLSGLADPDADISELTKNLASAIGIAMENVLPAVIDMGGGIVEAVGEGLEMLGFEGATAALEGYIGGIHEFADNVYPKLAETGDKIVEFIRENSDGFSNLASILGGTLVAGFTTVMDFAQFIMDNFPAVATLVGGVAGGMVAFKASMVISDTIAAFKTGLAASAAAEDGLAASQGILNAVMGANPIVKIVMLLSGLVAALIVAYNTNEDFRNIVNAAWEAVWGVIEPIAAGIGDALTALGGFFGDLLDDVGDWAAGVADFWSGAASDAAEYFGAVKGTIEADLEDAKVVGSESMAALTSIMAGDWDSAAQHAATAYETIRQNITDKLEATKQVAGSAADWIGAKLGFPGLGDTVRGVFNSIERFIEDPIGNARNFVRGIPGEIVGFFSGLGRRITDAIGSIHFPSPHVSWSGLDIGGVLNVPLPHVSWYAKGGILTRPTIFGEGDDGYLGGGEAGPEAVLPLSELRPIMAQALADTLGDSGNGVDIHDCTFVVRKESDIEDVAEALYRKIKRDQGGLLYA